MFIYLHVDEGAQTDYLVPMLFDIDTIQRIWPADPEEEGGRHCWIEVRDAKHGTKAYGLNEKFPDIVQMLTSLTEVAGFFDADPGAKPESSPPGD